MDDNGFKAILQQLNKGENPTPPTNNGGHPTPERGTVPGTRESDYALRPVEEGVEEGVEEIFHTSKK